MQARLSSRPGVSIARGLLARLLTILNVLQRVRGVDQPGIDVSDETEPLLSLPLAVKSSEITTPVVFLLQRALVCGPHYVVSNAESSAHAPCCNGSRIT